MYFNSLCLINAHVWHYNNKIFHLETDLISSENLACHLTLSYTILGSNDSLDFICHSQVYNSGHLFSRCTMYGSHFSKCMSIIFDIHPTRHFTMIQTVSLGLKS